MLLAIADLLQAHGFELAAIRALDAGTPVMIGPRHQLTPFADVDPIRASGRKIFGPFLVATSFDG